MTKFSSSQAYSTRSQNIRRGSHLAYARPTHASGDWHPGPPECSGAVRRTRSPSSPESGAGANMSSDPSGAAFFWGVSLDQSATLESRFQANPLDQELRGGLDQEVGGSEKPIRVRFSEATASTLSTRSTSICQQHMSVSSLVTWYNEGKVTSERAEPGFILSRGWQPTDLLDLPSSPL